MATKEKVTRTKLNLIQDSAQHIKTVQASCRTWEYDREKVMAALNCNYQQATVLIQLAQIEDAKAQPPAQGRARTA
jgi:hypothetical protein